MILSTDNPEPTSFLSRLYTWFGTGILALLLVSAIIVFVAILITVPMIDYYSYVHWFDIRATSAPLSTVELLFYNSVFLFTLTFLIIMVPKMVSDAYAIATDTE